MDVYRKKDRLKGWLTTDCENGDILVYSVGIGHTLLNRYNSLSKLFDEWEDYKSVEPYIDNDLVRALVRNWAYVNDIDKVEYNYYSADDNCSFIFTYDDGLELLLDFRYKIDNLTSGKKYTIAELCGEEE